MSVVNARVVCRVGVMSLLTALSVAPAHAQSGTIAGSARDATGLVLPGVTVEAASPALIEKVRSTVTDTQGEYKIVDLRPGTYTVAFTTPAPTVLPPIQRRSLIGEAIWAR